MKARFATHQEEDEPKVILQEQRKLRAFSGSASMMTSIDVWTVGEERLQSCNHTTQTCNTAKWQHLLRIAHSCRAEFTCAAVDKLH